MNTHRLDADEHEEFLSETRNDPYTGEPLTPGVEIVVCAGCRVAYLASSWDAYGGCAHGCLDGTLEQVPTSEDVVLTGDTEVDDEGDDGDRWTGTAATGDPEHTAYEPADPGPDPWEVDDGEEASLPEALVTLLFAASVLLVAASFVDETANWIGNLGSGNGSEVATTEGTSPENPEPEPPGEAAGGGGGGSAQGPDSVEQGQPEATDPNRAGTPAPPASREELLGRARAELAEAKSAHRKARYVAGYRAAREGVEILRSGLDPADPWPRGRELLDSLRQMRVLLDSACHTEADVARLRDEPIPECP